MRTALRTWIVAALALAALAAHAAEPKLLPWRGVNLAGAEFGEKNLPGLYDEDYIYPTVRSTAYFQSRGMNLVRVGFRWERLQRQLMGELDTTELGRLRAFVDGTTDRGLSVLLNPHNYARWHGHTVGSKQVPHAAFADFWRRVAEQFKDNPRVMFGLVNEPHTMKTETWVESANAAIAAIRATGARNVVSVPGNAWTGAWSWDSNYYGTPNSVAMKQIRDPGKNLLIEVHQYFDKDNSGTSPVCEGPGGAERLQRFTAWLREHKHKGLLGELGGGANASCEASIKAALDHLHANADVWAGWLWWAAGPWWGDYFLSIEPGPDGRDKPQMKWLTPYLPAR